MNINIQPCINPVPWAMCFITPEPINQDHVTAKHSFILGNETSEGKTCRACGERKEFSEFYSRVRNGTFTYNANCIKCTLALKRSPNADYMDNKKAAHLVQLEEREKSILTLLSAGPMRVSALIKATCLKKTTLNKSLVSLRDKGKAMQIGKDTKTMWTLK